MTAFFTFHPCKAIVQNTAVQIAVDNLFDVGPEITVFLCELVVIDLFRIFKIVLDTLVVLGSAWYSRNFFLIFQPNSHDRIRLIIGQAVSNICKIGGIMVHHPTFIFAILPNQGYDLAFNVIGVCVVLLLSRGMMQFFTPDFSESIRRAHTLFLPFSFLVPIFVVLLYERPIREYLNLKYAGKSFSEKERIHARQRLLNEPFFMIFLNLTVWMAASAYYPFELWISKHSSPAILQAFFMSFNTGLITAGVAFFVLERVLQRWLANLFFSKGGLYATPRTIHINIGIRIAALVFACNIVPQIATIGFVMNTRNMDEDPAVILGSLQSSIMLNAITFILVGIWLTFVVSTNFRRPLREIIGVLQDVRKGRLDQRVKVTSNDEIGFAGDVINEMNIGLQKIHLESTWPKKSGMKCFPAGFRWMGKKGM